MGRGTPEGPAIRSLHLVLNCRTGRATTVAVGNGSGRWRDTWAGTNTTGEGTLMQIQHPGLAAALRTQVASQGSSPLPATITGAAAGAAVGGIAGLVVGFATGGGITRAIVAGGALALLCGGAGALIGQRLLGGDSGGSSGQAVGIATGRKMIEHADGTAEWATVTAPLLLGKQVGAARGYATLTEAIAAAEPNTGNGEMAFMRNDAGVAAYLLKAPGLEAVESFTATDPAVVAYTTRMSGDLIAGPAATAAERAGNHLVDAASAAIAAAA